MTDRPRRWHHRPTHVFLPNTMYFVTAGTMNKAPFFDQPARRELLQDALHEVAVAYDWRLEAWAVFANHYHFIGLSPDRGRTLKRMIQRLHSQTSREVNRLDERRGRKVWFQYRDTCLTYENSYFARLNYVNENAVKHDMAAVAHAYPYCSASWFKAEADPTHRRKVESFRWDQLQITDDF
ncbi:transposase [Candidatus Sumerlaeota bacterium]